MTGSIPLCDSRVPFGVDDLLHRLHRIQFDALHDLTEHGCGLTAHQLDADTVFVSVENIVTAGHVPEDDVRDLVAVLSEVPGHLLVEGPGSDAGLPDDTLP